jgi:hypothetical protein
MLMDAIYFPPGIILRALQLLTYLIAIMTMEDACQLKLTLSSAGSIFPVLSQQVEW